MASLKITVGQINPTIGDIDGNIALMQQAAQQALADGAALLVFPELSLTGYYPADLLDEADFLASVDAGLQRPTGGGRRRSAKKQRAERG